MTSQSVKIKLLFKGLQVNINTNKHHYKSKMENIRGFQFETQISEASAGGNDSDDGCETEEDEAEVLINDDSWCSCTECVNIGTP